MTSNSNHNNAGVEALSSKSSILLILVLELMKDLPW